MPFDRIKIDRSLLRNLDVTYEAAAIVRGMIHLCTGLGASVTAEGVEIEQQISLLRSAGGLDIQGFDIGRSTAADQTRNWINAFIASRAHTRMEQAESAAR